MEIFYELNLNPASASFMSSSLHPSMRDCFFVYFHYVNNEIFTPTPTHPFLDFQSCITHNSLLLLPRDMLCDCDEQTVLDRNNTIYLHQAFSSVPISPDLLDIILPTIGECARDMILQIPQWRNHIWAINVWLNVTTIQSSEDDDVVDHHENQDASLSASQIADSLKKVEMFDVPSYFGDEECAICLEEFCSDQSKSGVVSTKCMHLFHKECIVKWLQSCISGGHSSYSCPLCRSQITMENVNVVGRASVP